MFHKPVAKEEKEEDDVYEILHLEKAGGGKQFPGLNLITVNKKLALTCGKEPTVSILCNKNESCTRARSNSTNRKLNSLLSVFKAPHSPQTNGTTQEAEEEEFMKRADPNLKVNFAPLPSRDSKCKVACGLAARAQLLNPGKVCRQSRYTGPTPRMLPKRSSSVPAPNPADDSTSLSRRNTSYEPNENLQAGDSLSRRHTASEYDSTCLSRRRSLPPTAEEMGLDEGSRGRASRVLPEPIEEEPSRPDMSRTSSVSWETTEDSLDSVVAHD